MSIIKSISLYWLCQLLGWSLAGLFWAFSARIQLNGNQFNYLLALLHFVLDVIVGIAVTHAYYLFAHHRKWENLRLEAMPLRLIPAVLIMGMLYMLLVMG
ncbi:MAG TPA: hypothetical protein VIM77_03815, partial [Mucilaginibacter sp.]